MKICSECDGFLYGYCSRCKLKGNRKMEIKDSGERRTFESGAVRDVSENKGRFDLMPLDIVAELMDDAVISGIAMYQATGRVECLYAALYEFALHNDIRMPNLMLDVAKHFEAGAKKYGVVNGKPNWMNGIPEESYIDSACRHYMKYLAGMDDEPHKEAFVWNVLALAWTHEHITLADDEIVLPELEGFEDITDELDTVFEGAGEAVNG